VIKRKIYNNYFVIISKTNLDTFIVANFIGDFLFFFTFISSEIFTGDFVGVEFRHFVIRLYSVKVFCSENNASGIEFEVDSCNFDSILEHT
jgi:hypothetical protein